MRQLVNESACFSGRFAVRLIFQRKKWVIARLLLGRKERSDWFGSEGGSEPCQPSGGPVARVRDRCTARTSCACRIAAHPTGHRAVACARGAERSGAGLRADPEPQPAAEDRCRAGHGPAGPSDPAAQLSANEGRRRPFRHPGRCAHACHAAEKQPYGRTAARAGASYASVAAHVAGARCRRDAGQQPCRSAGRQREPRQWRDRPQRHRDPAGKRQCRDDEREQRELRRQRKRLIGGQRQRLFRQWRQRQRLFGGCRQRE